VLSLVLKQVKKKEKVKGTFFFVKDVSFLGIKVRLSGIYTATIGSFPLDDLYVNRKRCIEDLIKIGIDFPNYPQLIEMGKQFLEDLVKQDCGIIEKDGSYLLKNEDIGEPSSPPGLEPYKWTLEYLTSIDALEKVKLKSSITGPFTLASYVKTGRGSFPFNTAISSLEKVKQLADIVSRSCRIFAEDAHMISIDEPILSITGGTTLFFEYDESDIIKIFNELKRSCGERLVGTHICGRISPKLAKILLATKLAFLSHEFHDTPENFNVYEKKESGKIFSIGCVSSRNPKVETVNEILKIMKKSMKYGDDLIFTPDCGFKNLRINGSREKGYMVSMKKLRILVEAANKLRNII